MVKSSAYALLAIINNVLDFSKIEAGKLELERTPFSLEHFLDEAGQDHGHESARQEPGAGLSHRMPTCRTHLVGDPNRLRQVVLNLVDNAIKFTEQRRGRRPRALHARGQRTGSGCSSR